MPHVIEPFTNSSLADALENLRAAHRYLVSQAKASISATDFDDSRWGTSLKRSPVPLNVGDVPRLIGKPQEKLGEVINIAATVERLMDAIAWFAKQTEYNGCSILECHPSTSDETNGNDLVLIDRAGHIIVRCEVCDVASSYAGSNSKEKKDIRNLGCNEEVPKDGVARYICTASEFAIALSSPNRKWISKPYRYRRIGVGSELSTCMLLIESDQKVETGK